VAEHVFVFEMAGVFRGLLLYVFVFMPSILVFIFHHLCSRILTFKMLEWFVWTKL